MCVCVNVCVFVCVVGTQRDDCYMDYTTATISFSISSSITFNITFSISFSIPLSPSPPPFPFPSPYPFPHFLSPPHRPVLTDIFSTSYPHTHTHTHTGRLSLPERLWIAFDFKQSCTKNGWMYVRSILCYCLLKFLDAVARNLCQIPFQFLKVDIVLELKVLVLMCRTYVLPACC